MNKYAYFTLLCSDSYLTGVYFLYESLKKVDSKYPLNIILTDNLSKRTLETLRQYAENRDIILHFVEDKEFKNFSTGLNRFKKTLNKFYVLNHKEYDKVIFLDIDFIITKNIDFLFDIKEEFFCFYRKDNFIHNPVNKTKYPDFIDSKVIDSIKNKYPSHNFILDNFISAGVIVLNPSYLNFDNIINDYQKEALPFDQFVISDIIIRKNILSNIKNTSEYLLNKNEEFKEFDKLNSAFFHYKFWEFPLHIKKKTKQFFTTENIQEFVHNFINDLSFRKIIIYEIENDKQTFLSKQSNIKIEFYKQDYSEYAINWLLKLWSFYLDQGGLIYTAYHCLETILNINPFDEYDYEKLFEIFKLKNDDEKFKDLKSNKEKLVIRLILLLKKFNINDQLTDIYNNLLGKNNLK